MPSNYNYKLTCVYIYVCIYVCTNVVPLTKRRANFWQRDKECGENTGIFFNRIKREGGEKKEENIGKEEEANEIM